jgi:2-dehydropantoate 2-reductase
MYTHPPISIFGAGAIGLPLAVHLQRAGRSVRVIRTSQPDAPPHTLTVTVQHGASAVSATIACIGLTHLQARDGISVVTTKAFANAILAQALAQRPSTGPIILLQNGIGVEAPFHAAGLNDVYRCILYITSSPLSTHHFSAHAVTPSPIGNVLGDGRNLAACVAALHTDPFPFCVAEQIQPAIWNKAIVNAVFNSICALLDTDAGVLLRNATSWELAQAVIAECIALTDRLGIDLDQQVVTEQIRRISQQSSGQIPSTLQDIRNRRPTEIDFLNLGIAGVAAQLQPPLAMPQTELLGRLVAAKSALHRTA